MSELPTLVSRLEADDAVLRASASRTLAEMRAYASPQDFLDALASPDARVTRWAATSLGLRGDPASYEPLAELLHSTDPVRREAGGFALGLLGDDRAVDGLVEMLSDEDTRVVQAAALALTRLGDERGAAAAWDRLLAQLREGDEEERSFAARTLGALSDPRSCDALCRALDDPSPSVRADAACALGGCAQRSAVERLLELGFRDVDAEVRDAAMFALARLSLPGSGAVQLA
jgi:HEAT repeat protein